MKVIFNVFCFHCMLLLIRLHLLLQRQLKSEGTNVSQVTPQRVSSLQFQFLTLSSCRELMEMLLLTCKWHIYWNMSSNGGFLLVDLSVILCICLSRSLTSQPSNTQHVQQGAGDAVQEQSKAGPTAPASGGTIITPTQATWNPFDDDNFSNNFSNLTAEEFKSEDKKPNGKVCVHR